MKTLILLALGAGLLCAAPVRAEYEEDGLTEAAVSTDTSKNGDEEEMQPLIQENDADLADFVTDYIKKDIQLKGAFFIEDKATRKILKLDISSVEKRSADSEGGAKKLAATLKDAAGKKFTVVFYLHNGPWGGLDIFKVELKPLAEKTKPVRK
jgi:hypothetical protein